MDLIIILILLASAALVLFIVLLLKFSSNKAVDITPQLIDLKNEINEMKTRQLEAQSQSFNQQQSLLLDTQKTLNSRLSDSQNAMNAQLNQVMDMMGRNLNSTQTNIITQLKNSNQVINEIQSTLGNLESTTKNIQEIGKDISSLQDILRAPKLRGNLGEYFLEDLLKQIFPSSNFQMHYSFKDGSMVDAIIRLGDGIGPVDSKFPLESFQRLIASEGDESKRKYKREFLDSVKHRIDEIADKYIRPNEGTFEFALMYIPAENVYYETIINDSLTNKSFEILNYAIARHVIPVSPNSFYAYLMAVGYGLKGFKIEQKAKVIMGELSHVQDRFNRFYGDFSLVGKHLSNAVGKYDESLKRAERFNDQLNNITGNKMDLIASE
jgi:DNA recombination protein RmuC